MRCRDLLFVGGSVRGGSGVMCICVGRPKVWDFLREIAEQAPLTVNRYAFVTIDWAFV
ncbi:hypothetical protein FRC0290_00733 [Corynebacterium diphtheriae]|nr:hypothetical protein FRC0290_00733 [Corynebacterium diphtheriae]